MRKIIKNHLPEITNFFKKHKVLLVLLFGSTMAGQQTKLFDLNSAVLLPENIPEKRYFDIQLELASNLGQVTKKQTDVVILNKTTPLLSQMVVAYSKVIVCQDEDLKADFFTKTLQKIDDALHLTKTSNQYLEKQVFGNKMGKEL